MNILVTGAKGFVGKNLCANLKNVRNGFDRTRNVQIDQIFEYDLDTEEKLLDSYCEQADFVFNLAGVNRPKDQAEFMQGNCIFAEKLLKMLKMHDNTCPVMLSSSVQASLTGRYEGSEYGRSKLEGEKLFQEYAEETGAKVLIYRFPNLFGKWCRPNYNSAVATFCNNIANDLPIQVNNADTELELLYIDDLVDEMFQALLGTEHRGADGICCAPVTYHVALGQIVNLLHEFAEQPRTLVIPDIPDGSFAKKLYSTYLSYLPKEKMLYQVEMTADHRGSFTELLKSKSCGQVSINISKPGKTKGDHWHNSKWEIFMVVKGHGLIQERRIDSDEYIEFEVSGDKIEAVQMLPGYTHNIINLSDTEDLVTVMWANENFDPEHPETYREIVAAEGTHGEKNE